MTLPGKTWKDQNRKRRRVVKTTKATKVKRLPKLVERR